ncbi:glycine/betaine ABC transporter periplasmic protein [Acetobacter estunensis NRIC 0472]|uniref:Glycine/betaine ABC transporter n=1 Tax=Acetobacter estunensis TaxID=104097 RepID=A0A967B8C7_9PROT|nr:glycine betaine ABC transporter substrate-binding protein [Acetobacter estunensis]MBV1835762.1 glycine betaine ABC transporter substrate-binding protein [Acetobacter estunensis]MBV1835977.1 glycine betaine ABC transporter substrate-binding protein [Acetobacter estunensis]NHO54570.1 glycine/betaine ABC transporter [Acetobacter estunensis]GBQ26741.1 glycine/betaine ABC transporter periplasmic protein [Acetobacter estunensis NRIC 0472]
MTTTPTLAYRNTPLHAAVAAAVARVLEAYDLEPDYLTGDGPSLAQMMGQGEIDIFATVWLPGEDEKFLSAAVEPLGCLYRPAFAFFVAERADSPLNGLTSVADVAASGAARHLITPESLLSHVRQMVAAYGLTEAGFTIETQPDEQAFSAIAAAVKSGEPVIAPLFSPCHLIHSLPLRPLDDPKKAGGNELEARLLISQAFRETADQDLVDELDELTLGNKVVSALDEAVRHLDMSPDEAAEEWQRGKLLPR